MTKDEYIKWKETRGDDAAQWRHEDCIAADQHIKDATLANLKNYLAALFVDAAVRKFVMTMASAYFGYMETDEFLSKIGVYPDYM